MAVDAQTIATSKKSSSWSETWADLSPDGFEFLSINGNAQLSSRVVGVEFENKGTNPSYTFEVFWFGFPLNDKSKRVVCQMVARPIHIPINSRMKIGVSANYHYVDQSLIYLKSDSSAYDWNGVFVRTWQGYTYGGWAVRLSDGKGRIVAQKAAQPSFLAHLNDFPAPRIK